MSAMSSSRRSSPRSLMSLTTYTTVLAEAPPGQVAPEQVPVPVPVQVETALTAENAGLPAEVETMTVTPSTARWAGIIGFEEETTGDGRVIAKEALRWPEDLAENPIPIRYVSSDVGAHDGAQVVGLIDKIERLAALENGSIPIWGEGVFDDAPEAAVAQEAFRHVEKKMTNGVSMDLDDVQFEVEDSKEKPGQEVMRTNDARIRAVTIVAIPAFAGARITIVDESSPEDTAEAEKTEAQKSADDSGLLPQSDAPAENVQVTSSEAVETFSSRGMRAQAITKAKLRKLASRPGVQFAYQTTKIKDPDGNWVETPAAAIDIASNSTAPDDPFEQGLSILNEADMLELGSPEYLAKVREALPLWEQAAATKSDRSKDAKQVLDILNAYLAVNWPDPEAVAQQQESGDTAQPADASAVNDAKVAPADQAPAAQAPAAPAAPAKAAAEGAKAFAVNQQHWRDPHTGRWLDMPGQILARLSGAFESLDSPDGDPSNGFYDYNLNHLDKANERAEKFIDHINDGDVLEAMDDLDEIREELEEVGFEKLGPSQQDDARNAVNDALDSIAKVRDVDWFSVDTGDDEVGSFDPEEEQDSSDSSDSSDGESMDPTEASDGLSADEDPFDVFLEELAAEDEAEKVVLAAEAAGRVVESRAEGVTPVTVTLWEGDEPKTYDELIDEWSTEFKVPDAQLYDLLPALMTQEGTPEWDELSSAAQSFVKMGQAGVNVHDALAIYLRTLEELGHGAQEIALASRTGQTFNWVDEVGGLPKFIRRIADHLIAKGMTESHAIAVAVSTVKRWARGGSAAKGKKGHVSAKTVAKAAAAVAEWEAKKIRAKASSAEATALASTDTVTASAAPLHSVVAERRHELLAQVRGEEVVAEAEAVVAGYRQGNATSQRPIVNLSSARKAPVAPPAEWFEDPKFDKATPIMVTEDGRVYGHLASWDVCHVASPAGEGVCIMAPKSRTGYAYFHTGAVRTAEGSQVATGRLVMNGQHADTRFSATKANAHYDDTTLAVADVRAGEDRFGIWVAGAIRPEITPAQLRTFRASPMSGDWRRIGGQLELTIGLSVNAPGYPVPRPNGLVASIGGDSEAVDHELVSLVAAGMLPPRKVLPPSDENALSTEDLKYLKGLAVQLRDAEKQAMQAKIRERADKLAAKLNREKVAAFVARREEMKGSEN